MHFQEPALLHFLIKSEKSFMKHESEFQSISWSHLPALIVMLRNPKTEQNMCEPDPWYHWCLLVIWLLFSILHRDCIVLCILLCCYLCTMWIMICILARSITLRNKLYSILSCILHLALHWIRILCIRISWPVQGGGSKWHQSSVTWVFCWTSSYLSKSFWLFSLLRKIQNNVPLRWTLSLCSRYPELVCKVFKVSIWCLLKVTQLRTWNLKLPRKLSMCAACSRWRHHV